MHQGTVEVLFILGGNPVYTSPADLQFAEHLQKVGSVFRLSLYEDETSRLRHLASTRSALPRSVERCACVRRYGVHRSAADLAALPWSIGPRVCWASIEGDRSPDGLQIVKAYWRDQKHDLNSSGEFDEFWQTALHDGVIRDSAFETKAVRLKDGWQSHIAKSASPVSKPSTRASWKLCSTPIPRSTTVVTRTTAGSRNSRNPSLN